jgi:hypothetical protein
VTDEFKKASVHELVSMIQLVDTRALKEENLDFVINWTTEGTVENSKYDAAIIIFFLENLEDR